jgi:uncharacterized protein (DUF2267 family)
VDYDGFVREVAARADVSRPEATVLARATLQTLGERLTGGEASDLAAQLPKELKEWLVGSAQPTAEAFRLDEFIRRVSERANVPPGEARQGARAVFLTLRDAVTGGEFTDMMSQLPKEFAELAED